MISLEQLASKLNITQIDEVIGGRACTTTLLGSVTCTISMSITEYTIKP